MSFRPTFWPTVMTFPALLLLLGLGTWQVQRLHWKEGLIAARHEAATGPAVPVPASLAAARGLEFHRVRAVGEFLYDHELYLIASSDRGNPGFDVFTPLRLRDGRLLIVNRGWVPLDRKDPHSRAAGQIEGPVAVEGLLRLAGGKPSMFTPDNEPGRDMWFWVDLPAMARAAGVGTVLPFYLDAGPAPNPGGWPRGGTTHLELPNHHLQYAITWYALAAGLLVIYVVYCREAGREKKEST
jgi:surfeit locus 1 family protein